MALIPDHFIQDLLSRTDIVEIIGERLELKRAGKEFKALSPFSNEKTPSFFVSPQKQMFFCFSSGKNGSALTFLQEYDRLSFPEAVEELARRAGLEVPREATTVVRQREADAPLYDTCSAASTWYRDNLRAPDFTQAVAYLKKRRISGETAKRFLIGFAPDSYSALRSRIRNDDTGQRAGLLAAADSGEIYDRFRNRIMFPIRDIRGRIVSFGGRTLGEDKPKYLNGPETAIFHKGRTLYGLFEARESSDRLDTLIIVEGYMDVVGLSQAGITNVAASLGTALTEDQLKLIFRYTKRVVFCFDGDRAGTDASWKALQSALPVLEGERAIAVAYMPQGLDPDEFVLEKGREAFEGLIREATPAIDGIVQTLCSQHRLDTAAGRAELATAAAPFIQAVPEGPHRDVLTAEIALRTGLTVQQVLNVKAVLPQRRIRRQHEQGSIAISSLVRRALTLLFDSPDIASARADLDAIDSSGEAGAPTLSSAISFFREHGPQPAIVASYFEHLPPDSEHARIGYAILHQQNPPLRATAGQAAPEYESIMKKLESLAIRQQLAELTQASMTRALTKAELDHFQRLVSQRQTLY